MSSQMKITFLLLLIFILTACKAQPGTTTPSEKGSPSITPKTISTLTPTVSPSSTPQDLEPKFLFSLGTGGNVPYYDVNYSPDGRFVFAIINDSTENPQLRWVDLTTKQELLSMPFNEIRSKGVIAYSQDSQLVAINTDIGIIDLYTTDDQQKFFSFNQQIGTDISNAMFSPDNHYFVYQSKDNDTYWKPQALFVWDLEKKQLAYMIPATSMENWKLHYDENDSTNIPPNPANPNGFSNSLISPNGKFLSVGDEDGNLFVWDLPTGKIRYQIKAHAAGIAGISFRPDGQLLASGSSDGTVRLWNMSTGKLARDINGLSHDVFAVDFTPDGKQLQISFFQYFPQVFDLATGQLSDLNVSLVTPNDPYLAYLLQQGHIRGRSRISPDGKTLVIYFFSYVSFWDISSKTVQGYWLAPKGTRIAGFGYDSQGHLLAILINTKYSDKSWFAVWDTQLNQQIFPSQGLQGFNDANDIVIDTSIASAGDLVALTTQYQIEIWSLSQKQNISKIKLNESGSSIDQIGFSPDGSQLYLKAVGGDNGNVYIFDVKSGQQIKVIKLSGAHTTLHGAWLASENAAEGQRWVELWNLETMTLQKLSVPGYVSSLCFTPDASLFYAATSDDLPVQGKPTKTKNYFWKTKTAELVYVSEKFALDCSTLSPDGRQMATTEDGKVNFWDTHAIIELVQQGTTNPVTLPTPTPQPTNTLGPTQTPQPTLALTLVPTPVLPAGAIAPENAAQIHGVARFGQGNIEQIVWPSDSSSILTIGSQGIYEYDTKTLARTNLQQQPGTLLKGVVLLSDGRRLAASQTGTKAQVWDLTNNKLLAEVTGTGPVISPDGKILAYLYGSYDNQVHLWDIDTGQSIADLSDKDNDQIIFSPDSQLVAAVQFDSFYRVANRSQDETVRVWDAHTGQIINALDGPASAITDISFGGDGKTIIGMAGGSVWIWPLTPATKPYTLTLDPGHVFHDVFRLFDIQVTSAALSPDGRVLAVATSQRDISFYDWQNKRVLHQIKGLDSAAHILHFSPNGQQLLSVDQNDRLTLWDTQTGKLLASQDEHTGPLDGLRFGDDDNLLTWANNTFRVIRPQDASIIHTTFTPEGKIFAASPDGLYLANYLPYHISLWNAQTSVLEQILPEEPDEVFDQASWGPRIDTSKDFTSAIFSRDSKLLAVGGTSGSWVYDLTGSLIARMQRNGYPHPKQVIFSPSGGQLASCDSMYCGPMIVNIGANEDASLHFRINGYKFANGFSFNPAGDLFAAIVGNESEPNEVHIWQSATGNLIKSLPVPQTDLTSIAFNADGRLIALGQADGKILLIETESLKVLATLTGHNGSVDHLAFSNTGKWLASAAADGSIDFWNIP